MRELLTDKAALLLALYENAKNSHWTQAFLKRTPGVIEFPKLTGAEILEMLDNTVRAHPECVFLSVIEGIVFCGDEVDTAGYDVKHHAGGGAALASDVIMRFTKAPLNPDQAAVVFQKMFRGRQSRKVTNLYGQSEGKEIEIYLPWGCNVSL